MISISRLKHLWCLWFHLDWTHIDVDDEDIFDECYKCGRRRRHFRYLRRLVIVNETFFGWFYEENQFEELPPMTKPNCRKRKTLLWRVILWKQQPQK